MPVSALLMNRKGDIRPEPGIAFSYQDMGISVLFKGILERDGAVEYEMAGLGKRGHV